MPSRSLIACCALAILCLCGGGALGQASYYSGTGHYYELIESSSLWEDARNAAESLSHLGLSGHLASITSQTENGFITDTLLGSAASAQYWIGGYQPLGSPEPDGNWSWVTGELWSYANWNSGAPDNNVDEGFLKILSAASSSGAGSWDDGGSETWGYIVEYEPATPVQQAPLTLPAVAIDPQVGRDHLVVVTHGWCDQGDGGWPEAMALAIRDQVDTSTWACHWYDWTEDASLAKSPFPKMAVVRAAAHGLNLGIAIAEHDFEHVHLIGHSTGAWLMSIAAAFIKEADPSVSVHLTFLDAQVPEGGEAVGTLLLGRVAEEDDSWADHYYVEDPEPGTQIDLLHAHNVNLLSIDPGWVADHGYPAQWYYDTIAVPGTAGSDTYGFIRSLEGGGAAEWQTSLGLPLGNPGAKTFKVKLANHHWDEGPLTLSQTGYVITEVDGLAMETGSAVWATMMLELVEGTNYISFDYRFDGAGEGQLAVYLNEELIFMADQRISANAFTESGLLPVGHLLEEYNYLSVRLDPLGNDQAGIWISNIESGVVMIPEPAVVALVPLVALALLARRRASRRILSNA